METPTQARYLVAEDEAGNFRGGAFLLAPGKRGGRATFQLTCANDEFDLVGSALVRALRAEAKSKGATILVPNRAAPEGGKLDSLLRGQGFDAGESITSYEADIETLWDSFAPLYHKLSERGVIPDDATLDPISQSPIGAVMELVRKTIGTQHSMLAKIERSGGFSESLSTVARCGSSVEGVVLLKESGEVPMIAFMAIEERSRHGWVFLALEYAMLKALREAGHSKVQFQTNPSIDPTITACAKRNDCERLSAETTFSLRLA